MNYPFLKKNYLFAGMILLSAFVIFSSFRIIEAMISNNQLGQFAGSLNNSNRPTDPDKNTIFTDIGISIKNFRSVTVDNTNIKWFTTEQGIVSFDDKKWVLHNKNPKVSLQDLNDIGSETGPNGTKLWVTSLKGATSVNLPLNGESVATTYSKGNSSILSDTVLKVVAGKGPIHWFGTAKGVSAQKEEKWLKADYVDYYPYELFQDFKITSMATNPGGDSLYVGTEGAGVARMMRNDVDAISGASVYAQWGPIILPSDKIYAVFIESNGTKWFGTDKGLARHTGNNTLQNWKVFTTKEGLIDNFVQSIGADKEGQLWIGTKSGVSVFNGMKWVSYTKDNGLNSNNILCITTDKQGVVWIGTDDGVNSYNQGKIVSYR